MPNAKGSSPLRDWRVLVAFAAATAGAALWWGAGSGTPRDDRHPRSSLGEDDTESVRAEAAVDRDRHPFFGMSVGASRTYAMDVSGQMGELTADLVNVVRAGRARTATWAFSFGLTGANPVTSRVERRCDREGAEEPWFGYGIDTALQLDRQTWRWPDALRIGLEFAGTVDAVIGSMRVTARPEHRVIGREPVSVPAGLFEAWRVETTDTPDVGGEPHHSTWWVVEHLGLVKSVQEVDAETTLVQELTHYQDGGPSGIP